MLRGGVKKRVNVPQGGVRNGKKKKTKVGWGLFQQCKKEKIGRGPFVQQVWDFILFSLSLEVA